MGSAAQIGMSDAAGGAPQPSGYSFVSSADPSKEASLYAFRSEIAEEPVQTVQPQGRATALRPILTLLALVGILGMLAVLAFPMLMPKPKPPALYVDLGNRRFEPAGLGGRLIVRWEGSPSYQLYIDPVDQEQAAGFQSLAVNPPHPLSVMIQLLDSTGVVGCQKEIVLPPPPPAGTPIDPTQVLMPKVTASGDTVQDMAGSDGKVGEITASGPLPCSLEAYQHLSGWQFTSNFPTVADQVGPLKHAVGSDFVASAQRPRSSTSSWRNPSPAFQRLNSPIEGDDVIVGDNAAKGLVDTSSGRVFMVGAATWQARSADWQIFPAAIHFHCERTGACILTRVSSRTILQAHLMK